MKPNTGVKSIRQNQEFYKKKKKRENKHVLSIISSHDNNTYAHPASQFALKFSLESIIVPGY